STEGGPVAAASTIADFFDAGFGAAHADALRAVLDELRSTRDRARQVELRSTRATIDRARSIVAVAERCANEMEALGVGRPSAALARATEALKRDAARVSARAIWIYGFSDATGLALDLLDVLRERCCARVYVDTTPASGDRASSFGARFRSRLVA